MQGKERGNIEGRDAVVATNTIELCIVTHKAEKESEREEKNPDVRSVKYFSFPPNIHTIFRLVVRVLCEERTERCGFSVL